MQQLTTNLRLLFTPLKLSSLSLSLPLTLSIKPYKTHLPLVTILASSSSKRHRSTTAPNLSRTSSGRGNSNSNSNSNKRTERHRGEQLQGTNMDKKTEFDSSGCENHHRNGGGGSNGSFGYNKRRLEGRDNDDKPKRNLQRRNRELNPTNTISYVQILGTGLDTQDTSPSVLLFFDRQRFIFNAGEGLQRFCTEHKIKLSKIDHIFLSRVCSETAGGIPGLLLTLAGMGEEGMSVNISGPSDLKYLVGAMKSFIPHAAMVYTKSFESDISVPIDNDLVKVSAIRLQPIGPDGLKVKPGDVSLIFICELPEIRGKFHPEKAKALGLNPGRKYGELQLGNSVKSDKQDILVHPNDVMDPSIPGPIVLVVDCPTDSHLQYLLTMKHLDHYYSDFSGNPPENIKTVNCIIHLSPTSVTNNPNYQKWMKRFSSAQQIMARHETKNLEVPILKSSARIAARLHYLCPQFFPAPGFWSLKDPNNFVQNSTASGQDNISKLCDSISAENLLKFTLRPHTQLGLDKASIPNSISPAEVIEQLLSEIPEIVDASKSVRRLWHEPLEKKDGEEVIEEPWLEQNGALPSCLENIRRDDLEIVLLGTGSSQPSKYRNVSSVYINLFRKGSLLLDCGEGTLGQLIRRCGVEGANDAVRNLNCIWISHIHADHHTGLARVLALRRDLLKGTSHEPLLVVGPRQLKRFLDAYQQLEDLDMQFLDCRSTSSLSWESFDRGDELPRNPTESTLFAGGSRMQSVLTKPGSPVDNVAAFPLLSRLRRVLNESGLESLISFPVVHCPQAFGVVVKASERTNNVGKVIPGWKIVYSGDTRPCPELIEASRGATVLIHEATFEDELVEEAVVRNHSTTKEAIEVGDAAGAYRVILTHFSQRYPKIPVFDETHMHNTCIAFDLMSINIADLPVLPRVLPYLKLLFRNEMVVDESDGLVEAGSGFA